MSRRRIVTLVVLAGSALTMAACSSSSPGSTSSGTTTPTTSAAAPTTAPSSNASAPAGPIPASALSPKGAPGKAPNVVVPTSKPPTGLESADLITGTGATAKAGNNVTVQYVLATYSTHQVIQSSWATTPFSFTLGQGRVIPGWDQGVVGMKVGGRRELIIPPSLGYGDQSPGAGIAVNDTLVFVIDLVKIN